MPLFSKIREGIATSWTKPAILEASLVPAIVLLVALGAFGLGRLSAAPGSLQALRIIYPDGVPAEPLANTAAVAAMAPASVHATEGAYVASKNGTKYYLAGCSGAKRIKPENKVYFVSASAARAAGYDPAANCPGL